MNKYELISKIERIAPLESQESWDCSGWIVDCDNPQVNKVMLALTVTEEVVDYAKNKGCDLIISHHPLFFVPMAFKDINIYASHTPMDKTTNGTTETLISAIGFDKFRVENDFVRIVDTNITVDELRTKLLKISPNLRMINNKHVTQIKSIGFCAGSGSEFISSTNTDAFVTGDLKYHTAVEADKVVFDIGHFESEIISIRRLKEIADLGEKGVIANEESPFN